MRTTFAVFALAALSATAPALAAPSIDEILSANKAAMGGDAWNGKTTLKLKMNYAGQGLTGKIVSLTDVKDGRFADSFILGPASGINGFNGKRAWAKDLSGTVTIQDGGEQRALAINEAYRRANAWWRPDHGGATITAAEKTEGGKIYNVLSVTPKNGKPFDAWFDAETHLLWRIVEKNGARMNISTLTNYATHDGVRIAGKVTSDSGLGEKFIEATTLTSAKFLPKQKADAFDAPKIAVTDFSIAGGAHKTTFPITLINNHIYGSVKVNDKGPYTFIFDTGGKNIITPKTAKALGVKVDGKLPVIGAGEGVMEAGFTKIAKLSVGDAALTDQLFVVVPLDRLNAIEGIEMPGMVGYEVFRRFVTQIDYQGGHITLIDPKHFDPKNAGTPVKFKFNDHIPEVMGTFEGIPAKFDVDTGSRAELTLTGPFGKKHDFIAKHPKGVHAVEGWGVGGASRGYVAMSKFVTIGDVKIDNVVTSTVTQEKGSFASAEYDGNIGSGILKRFIVTFDYNNMVMYLKPSPLPVADTGTFDRSGMWINETTGKDAGNFVIADITAKGPAEAAGLKTDDIITKVDGKPATDIHLYDLRKRLRNDAPGTKVIFTVKRGNTTKDIAVTLKTQI